MLRSIEKNFFKIVQRLGLLFAILAFAAVMVLSVMSYGKINIEASDQIDTPVIHFADYQNPISAKEAGVTIASKADDNFNQEFDVQLADIVTALEALPDTSIDKTDLAQKVKILVKIKSNDYPQDLQLAYATSLAKLTKQMVNVGGEKTNIDAFIKWHDQEFAKQVNAQTKNNFLRMGSLSAEKATGYAMLGSAAAALGIFIMFVMMLVMLRVERNTRQ
ncbi:MAG TPA: hypothetical protein EYJ00_00980 [Gammaproteobacteria bacterium]|nr:hypothetical protein [Gammaproteobacteria bacterium]